MEIISPVADVNSAIRKSSIRFSMINNPMSSETPSSPLHPLERRETSTMDYETNHISAVSPEYSSARHYSSTPLLPPLDLSPSQTIDVKQSTKRPQSADLLIGNVAKTKPESFSSHSLSPANHISVETDYQNKSGELHEIQSNPQAMNDPASSNSKEEQVRPDIPNWTQMLENLASFYSGEHSTPLNVRPSNSDAKSSQESAEATGPCVNMSPTNQFQELLGNINQFLFNPHVTTLDMQNNSTFSSQNATKDAQPNQSPLLFSQQMAYEQINSFPFSVANLDATISPGNTKSQQSSLAFTASILAMLASQKQGSFQPALNEGTYINQLPTESTVPFPFNSLINNLSSGNPSIFGTASSVVTPAPNQSSGPTYSSQPKSLVPNLLEGRDMLYQLGQRLMALAESPGMVDFPNKLQNEWKTPVTDFAPVSSSVFSSTNPAFVPNPFATMMNSSLFNQAHFKFPETAASKSSEKISCAFNPMTTTGYDKTLPHLPASGSSLSGISMRGNQKYSAYYQHQRKQGFHLGVVGDYGGQNCSRRQSGVTNSGTSSRYGGRRFRMNQGASLDVRSAQRLPTATAKPSLTSITSNLFNSNCRSSISQKNNSLNFSNLSVDKPPVSDHFLGTAPTASSCGTNTVSPSITARHRDTAFLCCCGRDFENLYVFTLHMKDTGHKPKSDQQERDIPKLVRGQDMWINSETEQTREILRCMRCHQSFRSLPELTMHMVKSNHYSEIVYNDSGRLVFVNPDEHRRGPSMSSTSTNQGKTAIMATTSGMGRRGPKHGFSNVSMATITQPSLSNGPQTTTMPDGARAAEAIDSGLAVALEMPETKRYCSTMHEESNEGDRWQNEKDSRGSTEHNQKLDDNDSGVNERSKTDVPKDSRRELGATVMTHSSPLSTGSLKPEEGSSISWSDRTKEEISKTTGDIVLRQMESFVEKKFPRTGKYASSKAEDRLNSSSQPSLSSPSTPSTDNSSWNSSFNINTHTDCKVFTGSKRTHSEDRHQISGTPTSTISAELECPSKYQGSPTKSPQDPGSLNSTKEPVPRVFENPLSSLQKLVETTHKPVPQSFASATSVPSTLFVSCNPLSPAAKISLANRMASGGGANFSIRSHYSPGYSNQMASSGSSQSGASSGSQFSQIISPVGESESLVPALSALYAYVEKSSPCRPHENRSPTNNDDAIHELTRQNNHSRQGKFDEACCSNDPHSVPTSFSLGNPSIPNLQSIYASIMSSLMTQLSGTNSSHAIEGAPKEGILCAYKQEATTIPDLPESACGYRSTESDLANKWLKVLHSIIQSRTGSENCRTTSSHCTETSKFSGPFKSNASSPRYVTGKDVAFDEPDRPGSTDTVNPIILSPTKQILHHSSATKTSYTGSSPKRPNNLTSSSAVHSSGYHPMIPNVAPGRYPSSSVSTRTLAPSTGSNSLMSTMITKKAKCHFCGKPFANKGQVRLHISKNKCPCLLQQSCHVAALAAAFGADARHHPGQTLNKSSTPSITGANHSQLFQSTTGKTMNIQTFSRSQTMDSHSALSLLEERFQNFDPVRSAVKPMAHTSTTTSTNPATQSSTASSTDAASFSMANNSFSALLNSSGTWLNKLTLPNAAVASQPDQKSEPNASNIPTSPAAASANADHLATMALLAQTLVQMAVPQSSSNEPSIASPGLFNTTSNIHRGGMQDFGSGLGMPFPLPPLENINLEILFNQLNAMKQLSIPKWNKQSTDAEGSGPASPGVFSGYQK